MESTYFRKGFGLKQEIKGTLEAEYHSHLVEAVKANGYALTVDGLTFRLAQEFGFCYGVDRAVEYAYETRRKFPGRPIHLVGEIIHNPHVNRKMEEMGIGFLHRANEGEFNFSALTSEDVVILPAFGVTKQDFDRLGQVGCVMVDTTCGSVLNVWKRVERYAKDGFTAIIHGKHYHEETKATASQVSKYPGGRYLVVLDMDETRMVCDFIVAGGEGRGEGDPPPLVSHFSKAVSAGFEFTRDLVKVGLANQTTMLSGESLAIADEIKRSMIRRYGEAHLEEHFRTFDTICSATQERQDAMLGLLEEPVDRMIVVGGFNSSNTCHLAALAARKGIPTFHIEDASCVDVATGRIRHQVVDTKELVEEENWVGDARAIGITAGASTPNNKIGETITRICAVAGVDLDAALA